MSSTDSKGTQLDASSSSPGPDLKTDVSTHFEFGENWAAYAEHINPERIKQAEMALETLVSESEIKGQRILDIGSGSGLHSLAFLNLGAASVNAVDIDPMSVKTSQATIEKFGTPERFECQVGNVFELPFEQTVRFDIVYSWGVLHHTGSLWEAIEQTIQRVEPGGKLVIAIYLKTRFCGFWQAEKRFFTRLPRWLRYPIIWLYCALGLLRIIFGGNNPFAYIKRYKKERGMSWYRDRIDWLGGYPYESASAQEIEDFVSVRGGTLKKSLNTCPSIGLFGSGCAEYVFQF